MEVYDSWIFNTIGWLRKHASNTLYLVSLDKLEAYPFTVEPDRWLPQFEGDVGDNRSLTT